MESPAGSWRVTPSTHGGQGDVWGVGHWKGNCWRDGGVQLWDLLSCFPPGGCSALAGAVVQQGLGSELALQSKVVTVSSELRFAGWGTAGHCSKDIKEILSGTERRRISFS